MSHSPKPERAGGDAVFRLLRAAYDGQTPPATGHVVEDEELLACWEAGLLTPRQRDEIIAHLAACPRCRAEVASQIRSGKLEWAEPGDCPDFRISREAATNMGRSPLADADIGPRPPAARSRNWMRPLVSLAVAASLLVAVGLVGLFSFNRGPVRIAAGTPLAERGRVTDYGCLLDGQSMTKGPLAPVDAALEKRHKELLAAMEARPTDRALRVEYAELLLRLDEPATAANVFGELVKADPRDPAGRLGHGLAFFLRGNFAGALEDFEVVLKADPTNTSAKLNAAASLAQLGRRDEAVILWKQVLAETRDAELRRHLEQTIEANHARPQ